MIPTDDLVARDLSPAMLERMPNLREEMVEGGTTFVTNSVCCPSRATVPRGQYAHNHQVLFNGLSLGGAERFRISGGDASTAATWLGGEGYRTAFCGRAAVSHDLGPFGAALWSVFGAGWVWLGLALFFGVLRAWRRREPAFGVAVNAVDPGLTGTKMVSAD